MSDDFKEIKKEIEELKLKKDKLLKQLRDAGYTTKKGKFGAVKTKKKSSKGRKSRKTRRCRHKSGKKKGKFKKC